MPLYIFISGYLFSYLFNKKGKYTSFFGFIKNKFERLIIPYIIFSVLIALTYNQFSLKYFENFIDGYENLWFILMLFESFVIARLLACIKNVNEHFWLQSIILIISFIFSIVFGLRVTHFLGFNFVVIFFVWFWLGYITLLNKEKLFRLSKYKYVITFIVVWITFCVLFELFCPKYSWGYSNSFEYRLVKDLSYFSIIISIFLLVNKKIEQGFHAPQWVENLNQYSYGIYIFHCWILFYFFNLGCPVYSKIQKLATAHYIIFPIIAFVFLFLSSLFITKLLLNFRVGRFLLGNSPSTKTSKINNF